MKNCLPTQVPSFALGCRLATVALLVLVFAVVPATAQQPASGGTATSYLDEFRTLEGRIGDRIIELGKEIPAKHYDWRPAEGVRSVSELLTHVAAANIGSARAMGTPMPEDLPQDLSKVTDKEQVIALLETSFQLSRSTADALAGADFTQPVPGGNGMTLRAAMMAFVEHQGEHLGQLIAYARSVGVTPPWSR